MEKINIIFKSLPKFTKIATHSLSVDEIEIMLKYSQYVVLNKHKYKIVKKQTSVNILGGFRKSSCELTVFVELVSFLDK